MKKHVCLTVYMNDLNAPSEVFLRQLFNAIGHSFPLEILTFKPTAGNKEPYSFRVRKVKSAYSMAFIMGLMPLVARYKTFNIRLLYRLFILETAAATRLYFPFLYMLTGFEKALPMFMARNKAKIFSSIRGTEVTINPITRPGIIDTYRALEPHLYKLHFLSGLLQRQYTALGLQAPNAQVIYQGVDTAKFLGNTRLPTDKLRIISVGRFNYVKGIEYLLLACNLLKQKKIDFQCTIAGYGDEKDKYRYMIHDLGLADQVVIREQVHHSDLPSLLTNHNVYVHPHLVTGISNSMLEAFASGLKIIAFYSDFEGYAIPHLGDYFKEVPRYDVMNLAEALYDFDYRYRISESARLQILETFTLEAQTAAFIDFFELNSGQKSNSGH